MLINLTPVPKPRMTTADRWKKRPAVLRYRQFCDDLRASGAELRSGFKVFFGMPMPISWSEKKRRAMDGEPHEQRPDLDNMIKSIMDALLEEDCAVWEIRHAEKRWAETGFIMIENQ